MRTTFVETENVRRFQGKLTAYQERGAREACMIIVDGKPGLGKTMVVRRWMAQTGSLASALCRDPSAGRQDPEACAGSENLPAQR